MGLNPIAASQHFSKKKLKCANSRGLDLCYSLSLVLDGLDDALAGSRAGWKKAGEDANE